MAAAPSLGRADGVREGASSASVATRLYEEHHARVLRYCSFRLASREEGEDAAQSTFLHVFRALERGVVPQSEAGWVFGIAKNVCLERLRARGRRSRRELPQDPQTIASVSAAPEPESDRLRGIGEALGRLPEKQRRAIVLREWRGLSYREIADELGISGPAVETLIFRARRSLAALLEPQQPPKRRRGVAALLDLGSAAAALKSLLAGSGAKLAAAGLATATLAAGAGTVLTVHDGPAQPPSRPAGVDSAAARAPAAEHPRAHALPPATGSERPSEAAPGDRAAPEGRKAPTAPPRAPVVDEVVDVVGQTPLPVEIDPPPLPVDPAGVPGVPSAEGVVEDVGGLVGDALP